MKFAKTCLTKSTEFQVTPTNSSSKTNLNIIKEQNAKQVDGVLLLGDCMP